MIIQGRRKGYAMIRLFIIYCFIINLVGLVIMKVDKEKAKRKAWRIPEKTLFTIALLSGSLGIALGMKLFRHKTKHKSFVIGIPVIMILQIVSFIGIGYLLS